MNRAATVRALLALAVLAISVFYVVTKDPRLGLDLRGGSQIMLQTSDSPTGVKADREATDRTLEVLRRRVDSLGVAEPSLTRSGNNRIIVELPGVQDPKKAAEVLGKTAQLTFHPVLAQVAPQPPAGTTPTAPGTPGARPAPGSSASPGAPASSVPRPRPIPAAASTPAAPTPPSSGAASTPGAGTPSPSAGATPPAGADKAAENAFDPRKEQTVPDETGQPVRLGPAGMTGEGVEGADGQINPQAATQGWFVTIDFRGSGEKSWAQLTGKAACAQPGDPQRRVAIVLDGKVISSPQVDPQVGCNVGILGGSTQITGNFTPEEAQDLALLIRGGSLPVPVSIEEQRTVGPTLGKQAIDASAKAAVIGVVFTALFIIFVYRLFGLMAAIALICYGLISYAALLVLGATLTLPGLAGFVLAIGMAVDANVLVFERAREEFRAATGKAKSLRSATLAGFRNAFSAIIDSNVTTLLAAGLLFFLASGPVRGFGVTLSIGVLASMVSALLITRVLVEFVANRKFVQKRPQISGINDLGRVREWLQAKNPDLMKHRRRWLAISGIALVIAVSGIGIRGLNFGVEFTGGRLVQYTTERPVDIEAAREKVAAAGFPRAVVQEAEGGAISVRTGEMSNEQQDKVRAGIAELGGGASVKTDELIGPSLGDELRIKALIALGVALAAQLIYLAVRFRWTFGAAAVTAMAHDVLILIGVFAWFGKPIDGVFLAALLTVIGYSVNDSVVVFDRVRELWRANRKKPFPEVANLAILQTIPRTVNTGLGAIFILTALAFLGGDTLTDFAIALLIGIGVGTYSSMFTAAPVAIELEARSSAPPPPAAASKAVSTAGAGRPRQARPRREPGDSGAVV